MLFQKTDAAIELCVAIIPANILQIMKMLKDYRKLCTKGMGVKDVRIMVSCTIPDKLQCIH